MNFITICVFISGLSFLFYGISYFVAPKMKSEFKRFNLEKLGLLVIILEICGALGLLFGLWFKPLLIFSSGGLSLLMFLGIIVRMRLKDSLLITIPALFFMLINAYIFYESI
jgi:DoxX-like family